MLTQKVLFPDKQKKRCIYEIITPIERLKTPKARKIAAERSLVCFYDELVKLPFPFQIAEAKKWLEFLRDEEGNINSEKNTFKTSEEKKAFKYISDISAMEPDFYQEINEARQRNKSLLREITQLLKSLDDRSYNKLTERAGGLNMLRLESYLHMSDR